MAISKTQVQMLLKTEPEQRYQHTIKMICDFEEMYSLLDKDGLWKTGVVDGKETFLIWSAKEYVLPFLTGLRESCAIRKITIQEFTTDIMEYLNNNRLLINVFAVENSGGSVVTVDQFITDLNKEMDNY